MKTYGRSGLWRNNETFTQEKQKEKELIHGTNMEIWRGCCNQSLESSAFRRGVSPPFAKLEVKLSQIYVQTNFKISIKRIA